MNAPPPSKPTSPPLDRQKAALIKLLTDEDPVIHRMVRDKILSAGSEGVQWLRPFILSNDPICRRRAREILHHVERQDADNEFLAFCLNQGEEFDLEHAVFLLARTRDPDVNLDAYHAVLDVYAGDLVERFGSSHGAERLLSILNRFLFDELQFHGNEQEYYDPENSYLDRVIDRRTGNPISLCLVYLFIVRRLRLPVTGIGMPGHFLLRYQSSQEEFYIDAFHRGKLLTKANCVKYLMQTSGFQESYLAPASSRRILLRICSNLHQIYCHLQLPAEIARLQRYIIALAK